MNDLIVPHVNKIGSSLEEGKKNIYSAEYRIGKLDTMIPKINISLSQQHYPTSAVIPSFVNQCLNAISCIEQIIQKIEDCNDTISINLDIIKILKIQTNSIKENIPRTSNT